MIEAIPNVNFSNQQLKNAYLGEAYFLRAYTHWFLFLNFRNIPLMKELPKSAKDYKPQATPEEAWDFIISDLKRAKELLPEKGFWKGESIGRVTKGSAIALLGKAYLYRSGIERYYGNSTTTYYNEAAAEFNELILSGKYRLVADYNDNFKVATENNDESIFELQFLGDVTNTGFNPGLSNSGVWRDPRGYLPPTNKNASSSVIHDWVYNTFVNSKDASGHTDPRMFGTLIFDDTKPEINARTGDEVRIFDNNFYMWNGRANGLNQIEIRYADVLLMYAEAVVNGGTQGSLSALDAVNQVRARVGMPAVAAVNMNVIENERILELTQEGHRFFDLLRWGKVVQRFRELEASDPNFKQYNNSAYLRFQENKNEWLPLPVDEVEGNPYIQRNNPGW